LLFEDCEPPSRIAPFSRVQILWHRFPLLERLRDVTHAVYLKRSPVFGIRFVPQEYKSGEVHLNLQ
jgi:hypothetical protein